MKTLSFIALFFGGVIFAQAQEESNQTLVKSFDTESATSIDFRIKSADINPQPWGNADNYNVFRVEVTIKANMPLAILEQLVKAGRYSLEGKKDGDVFIVSAPNVEKNVVVRGKTLEEEIVINVKTPGHYVLSDKTLSKEAIAARTLNAEQAKEYFKIKSSIELPNVTIQSTLKDPNIKIPIKTGDIVIDGEALEITE